MPDSDLHAVAVALIDTDNGGTHPATLRISPGDTTDLSALPPFASDPTAAVRVYDDTSERLLVVIRALDDGLLAAVLPED